MKKPGLNTMRTIATLIIEEPAEQTEEPSPAPEPKEERPKQRVVVIDPPYREAMRAAVVRRQTELERSIEPVCSIYGPPGRVGREPRVSRRCRVNEDGSLGVGFTDPPSPAYRDPVYTVPRGGWRYEWW